ncbi:MarR family winged helix-turn-helix transcriptional regulator [Amaricoccus solimangrovi]|nr:MarR family transcriptional regulator [Amaricoccus solimangrovi]
MTSEDRPELRESNCPEALVPMRARVPGHLARRFHRVHVSMLGEALRPVGLDAAAYGMLVSIGRSPGMRQRALAEARGLDPASAGQIIDALQNRGLVRRCPDPNDRRAWLLELTDEGRKTRERAAPLALGAQARMLRVLSEQEVSQLADLMARVIEANADHDRPGAGRRKPARKAEERIG